MNSKLIVLTITRRSISAAAFTGKSVEHLETLHLSADLQKALSSLSRVISWAIEHFRPDSAAFSVSRVLRGERIRLLTEQAETILRAAGIPIHQIEEDALLETYAAKKLKSKAALRSIALSFWPQFTKKKNGALDAALAGFYFQVERLLSHH